MFVLFPSCLQRKFQPSSEECFFRSFFPLKETSSPTKFRVNIPSANLPRMKARQWPVAALPVVQRSIYSQVQGTTSIIQRRPHSACGAWYTMSSQRMHNTSNEKVNRCSRFCPTEIAIILSTNICFSSRKGLRVEGSGAQHCLTVFSLRFPLGGKISREPLLVEPC